MSSIMSVTLVLSLVLPLGRVVTSVNICQVKYGDGIVLHRSYQDDGQQACCKAIRCPPGEHAVLCNVNDPNSTTCRPCPINTYQSHSTDSVDMRYCDSKTTCPISDKETTVDDDSLVRDRKCVCNLEKGYCNSSRNRSIYCVEGDCPPGKQLNHNCSCSDCPIGFFKDVSGFGRCKQWRNCRDERRRTSVEGTLTTDRVCTNSTYDTRVGTKNPAVTPSVDQLTNTPVTEDQSGTDHEQTTDTNNTDTAWKIGVILAAVIVLAVLIIIGAFICYKCRRRISIPGRFGELCKNMYCKPAQNPPNQDQGSGDKLLPDHQKDSPDVVVDKDNRRQQPLNGHVQCDNSGEDSQKLLKEQPDSSEEDKDQHDGNSVTETGRHLKTLDESVPNPPNADQEHLTEPLTDPSDACIAVGNNKQEPNEALPLDNMPNGDAGQNLDQTLPDAPPKVKHQDDRNCPRTPERDHEDPFAMMTPRMKNNITSHGVDLSRGLIVDDDFLAVLIVNGTINSSMAEIIQKEQTRSGKVSRFLYFLLTRPVLSYKTFIYALICTDQPHLAEAIDPELAEEYKKLSDIDPQKMLLSFGNLNFVQER